MSLQGTLTVCASSPCSRRRRAAAVSVYQAGCWCWPWRRSVTRWGGSQTSKHKKVWFEIRWKARLLFLVTKGNRVMTKIASKVKSKEMFSIFGRFLDVLISCFSAFLFAVCNFWNNSTKEPRFCFYLMSPEITFYPASLDSWHSGVMVPRAVIKNLTYIRVP